MEHPFFPTTTTRAEALRWLIQPYNLIHLLFRSHSSSAPKGIKRKWSLIDGPVDQQIESSLCLRLGHSSSSSDSKGSAATACTSMSSAKETEEESSMDLELDFTLHLGSEKSLNPRKSASLKFPSAHLKVDLELSLSSGIAESDITTFYPSSTSAKNVLNRAFTGDGALNTDEGSMGSPFYPFSTARDMENTNFLSQAPRQLKPSISPDLSASVMTTPKSSVTCTSGITQLQQQRTSSAKQCQFQGCSKGARGASGLCIAHGGGRRCQRPGCHKGAEGRTAFCKAHGGGRRCEFLGCGPHFRLCLLAQKCRMGITWIKRVKRSLRLLGYMLKIWGRGPAVQFWKLHGKPLNFKRSNIYVKKVVGLIYPYDFGLKDLLHKKSSK
ncbi:uncharacterized protein Fot_55214 [Forsythia ovata]|uniref:WRKY19-like zinc finger domain-containing protein n=1 Tax=Forsythia ovata TaxID=205694 RepID=A0ABD1P4X6_9LAMI